MKTIQITFILFFIVNSTRITQSESYKSAKIADRMQQRSREINYQSQQQFYQNKTINISNEQNLKNSSFSLRRDIENRIRYSKNQTTGIEHHKNEQNTVEHSQNLINDLIQAEKQLKQLQKSSSIRYCTDIFEKTNCLVSKIQGLQCNWTNNQCLTTCNAISSKDECLRNSGDRNAQKCLFIKNQNDNNVRLNCQQRSSNCKYDELNQYSCIWLNNQCQEAQCYQFQDQLQCNDHSSCFWHSNMKKCVKNTELSQYEKPCEISLQNSILSILLSLFLILQ